jgi:hypothetical protein
MKTKLCRCSALYLLLIAVVSQGSSVIGDPWQSDVSPSTNRAQGDLHTTKRTAVAALDASHVTELQCGDTNTIKVTCPPYNAVPNDNADDSESFQAAVNALPHSGGRLLIPAGIYLFSHPLLLQKSVELLGAGAATILAHSTDLGSNGEANFIRIGGSAAVTRDVTIRGLTLEGPQRSDLRTSMIRIANNVKGVRIQDVLFKNISSTCILLYGNNIQNVEISGNRAEEFYEQFVELARGGISNVRIDRNVAKSTRGHPKLGSIEPFGILFEPKMNGDITDVKIISNEVSFDGMSRTELVNTGGISLGVGDGVPYLYRRIIVQNNTIRTVGVGIRVETLRSGAVSGPGSVAVRKNRIEGAQSHGIQVSPAADGSHRDRVSLAENTIRGYSAQAYNRYDGIHLAGRGIGVEITSNKILPVAGRKEGYGRYGISIEAGIQDPLIRDNRIGGYMAGALLNQAASGENQR